MAIGFEADVLYTMKGYEVAPVVRFHYIEAPLLARISSGDDASPMRVFAHAGIAPAVLAWCHESGVAFDNDRQESYSYSSACGDAPVVDRTPSRFDLGAVIGAGLGWDLDVRVIELQLRYARSLLDIEPDEGGKTVNHGFYVLAGFGTAIGGQ